MATWLRDWRKERLLTQEEAAKRIGVTPVTISRWETSAYPIPDSLQARLDYLAIPPRITPWNHPELFTRSKLGRRRWIYTAKPGVRARGPFILPK